jgi:hypothetical protein
MRIGVLYESVAVHNSFWPLGRHEDELSPLETELDDGDITFIAFSITKYQPPDSEAWFPCFNVQKIVKVFDAPYHSLL